MNNYDNPLDFFFVDYLKTRVPRATVCPVLVFAPAKNVKGTFLFGQSYLVCTDNLEIEGDSFSGMAGLNPKIFSPSRSLICRLRDGLEKSDIVKNESPPI